MKNSRKLKQHVSARTKYCWGEVCIIFFITVGALAVFLISWIMIAGMTGSITNPYDAVLSAAVETILLWLVFTPFSYGVKWYRIQQVRGKSVPARGIFSCYMSLSRLISVIHLNLIISLRKLCVTAPAAAAAAGAYYLLTRGGNIILYCAAASFMLIFAGLIAMSFILSIRYALLSYIYVLKPDIPIKNLIRESRRLARGKIFYCVKILLSIAWLIIPCLLIFPAVFIVPYMQMVYTAMINEIIRQEERYADYEAG